MKSIRAYSSQELIWKHPKVFKQEYELHAGEDMVATLRWQKSLGSLALAETADGNWTFKRTGFLHPHVTARVPGSEIDIATFEPNWQGGGTLNLAQSGLLRWSHIDFGGITGFGKTLRAGPWFILRTNSAGPRSKGTLSLTPLLVRSPNWHCWHL